MDALSPILNILKVALGLGFVIFLHELGHFLLAKWNGVKVEKFSIGFGPTLLGFTRGETEYVLAAVPLGGFVKMLGEGVEDEANKSSDPSAYPNKSVSARMAIISAGVIMNLILGLACFVYAYEMGMDEIPAKVGSVMSGAPAYRAGFRPGDEIVSLDGRRDLNFAKVTLKIRLSGHGQVLHFELKRPGQDGLIPLDIEPRREASADVPGIGISFSESLELSKVPFHEPAGMVATKTDPAKQFKPEDLVVAAGPEGGEAQPVGDIQDLYKILTQYRGEPLQLVLRRETKQGEGVPPKVEKATAVLPPNRFVDFGFRLKIEPVSAIRDDSPADKAGFHRGDRILAVDGKDDFDPMHLPTYCYEHAGQPVTFEVERVNPGVGVKKVTLEATPDDSLVWTEFPFKGEPLDVPGLGLVYPVRTKVESVTPDSPAAKAGIKPGDVINALTFESTRKKFKPWRWPFSLVFKNEPEPDVTFDEESTNWAFAFQAIQLRPREPIDLRVNNADALVRITPEPVASWPHPLRGEQFQILTRRTPPMTIATALSRGWDDTVDNILSIYAMFRSLAQSRVSPKNLGGPILISTVAYEAATLGLTDLIHFLGILSINLAVLNFLPVPPLDGGQMVFLIAEKIRGRPLPESAVAAGTWMGVFMVIMLMAFVFFQDISRLVTGFF